MVDFCKHWDVVSRSNGNNHGITGEIEPVAEGRVVFKRGQAGCLFGHIKVFIKVCLLLLVI